MRQRRLQSEGSARHLTPASAAAAAGAAGQPLQGVARPGRNASVLGRSAGGVSAMLRRDVCVAMTASTGGSSYDKQAAAERGYRRAKQLLAGGRDRCAAGRPLSATAAAALPTRSGVNRRVDSSALRRRRRAVNVRAPSFSPANFKRCR